MRALRSRTAFARARDLALLSLAVVSLVPSSVAFGADETQPSEPPAESSVPDPTESTSDVPDSTSDVPDSPPSSEPPESSTPTSEAPVGSAPVDSTPETTDAEPAPATTTTSTPATVAPAPSFVVTAAAAAVPAPTCRTYTTVRLGSRGDPARCVETRLTQLGYWLQGPDDNFDSTAVTALRMFQGRTGLTVDGVAAAPTLQALGIWTVAPVRPAPTCYTYRTVQQGSVGDPARCVETRLRQFGYWLQGPDATFDATAVSALRIFQTRSGLPADGIGNVATLSALGIWVAPPTRPAPSCSTAWTVVLGNTGFPSRCVETRLRQFGYWLTGPDDVFDSSAAAALRTFQAREGMPSTGVADTTTLRRLGIYGATRWPAPATCRVHYAVSIGMSDASARCVEQRLVQLGYWLSGPDQTFDSTAAAAVRKFQYWNGLATDGVAGQRTLMRMGIYTSVAPAFPPVPANSGTGRRIVYSRSQQRIWAVNADGTVAKSHRVSGRTYEPYSGTYYVYSRSMYTYSTNDPSVRWRYMIRFTYGFQGGRIGFHEIPNRNGVPLQTSEQLGLPLSSGCVRQSTSDAAWLWSWAPVGTKVVVL